MNGKQFRTNQVDKGYRLYKLQEGLHIDFPVDDNTVVLNEGVIVSLDNSGTVYQSTNSDVPFGIVTSKFDPEQILPAQEDRVVVRVFGCEVVGALAGAAIVAGQLVAQNGLNAADPLRGQYIAATAGQYAIGIALNDAAAIGDSVDVLVLNAPVLIP